MVITSLQRKDKSNSQLQQIAAGFNKSIMKGTYILGFGVLLALLISCNKKMKQQPESPSTDENEMKLFWQRTLSDSSINYMSIDPHIVNEQLIISYIQIFSDVSEKIISLDIEDGSQNWSWENYIRPGAQRVSGTQRVHFNDNIMTVCSSQDNYAIDINNGESIWATNIEDGNPRTNIYNDMLFHTITYGIAPYGDSTKIIVRPVGNGEWRDVYLIAKEDEYEVNFEAPSVYINQDNDTLIIFQNRQITLSPIDEKVDLFCYNITQDSILWFKSDLTSSGSSNVRAPIVEGDLVYFAGKWDFFCIDIPTGEVQWMHNFYHDFQGSNFLVYNNLIITNLDNGDLIAIDKHSGAQVWVNVGLSGCCTELRIYEDRIYFGNDKLFIVEASTGDLLYKLKSPNPGGSFHNAIAVDVVEKRMYTTDGSYAICMELPE